MVNVIREESFLSSTETVAEATACLASVSNAIPLMLPFFCATADRDKARIARDRRKMYAFLISGILYEYENILTRREYGLIWFGLMLKKVNDRSVSWQSAAGQINTYGRRIGPRR
jgi:hypothetical protein